MLSRLFDCLAPYFIKLRDISHDMELSSVQYRLHNTQSDIPVLVLFLDHHR